MFEIKSKINHIVYNLFSFLKHTMFSQILIVTTNSFFYKVGDAEMKYEMRVSQTHNVIKQITFWGVV